MGIPELIVLLIILIPFIVIAVLRKYYPNHLWVGIILCLFFGGIGQFYIPKGGWYFFGLALVYVLLNAVTHNPASSMMIANSISVPVIWWRFSKLNNGKQAT